MVNTSRQSVNTFEDGADDDDDHDEYENQKKTVISLEIIKATGIKLGKETYVIVRQVFKFVISQAVTGMVLAKIITWKV